MFEVHLTILHASNCRTLKESRKVCCRVLGFHRLITSQHSTHTHTTMLDAHPTIFSRVLGLLSSFRFVSEFWICCRVSGSHRLITSHHFTYTHTTGLDVHPTIFVSEFYGTIFPGDRFSGILFPGIFYSGIFFQATTFRGPFFRGFFFWDSFDIYSNAVEIYFRAKNLYMSHTYILFSWHNFHHCRGWISTSHRLRSALRMWVCIDEIISSEEIKIWYRVSILFTASLVQ